jgi:formiminotetrahydrofolate cyclodeaminase/Zn-dependent peptidase ImmA (M78 family)
MAKELLDLSINELLEKFGAGSHKPGSGSAAAMLGLIACKMTQTVIKLTLEPKRYNKYKDVQSDFKIIKDEIQNTIEPILKEALQDDAIVFDKVINARVERNDEKNLMRRLPLEGKALAYQKDATEIPIKIAEECIKLAHYAIEVFDKGFHSARGDSAVAISSALSGASGAVSIIHLNLISYSGEEWAMSKIQEVNILNDEVIDLQKRLSKRIEKLKGEAKEANAPFKMDLAAIEVRQNKNGSNSYEEIERVANHLRKKLWKKKRSIWKEELPSTYSEIFTPEVLIKSVGFNFEKKPLGDYEKEGEQFEIAGMIDRNKNLVSVSSEYPIDVQNFTTAHELGHLILHQNEVVLHRDRPLDGASDDSKKDRIEVEANKFATFFLMPEKELKQIFGENFQTKVFELNQDTAFALGYATEDEVRTKFKSKRALCRLLAQQSTYHNSSIEPLVERFKVSVEAMAIRLEELNLIKY